MAGAGQTGAVFVLGGARSGKTAFAETRVIQTGLPKTYLATGRAWDEEMTARIALHKQSRAGQGWQTLEEPLLLVETLDAIDRPGHAVLVDCLTLWLTNLMMDERDIAAETARLAARLAAPVGLIVLVSNEVGLGIVPENRMAREFRDHAGRLHQAVAAVAQEVHFVAAGLSLRMKG